MATLNLRDAWRSQADFSLSIPAAAKPGLYARIRRIVQAPRLYWALPATALLAIIVNVVELLCTAGFPAIYTAVLTQQVDNALAHYAYLGLYIVGYLVDDTLMVAVAVIALSQRRLTERSGRVLKALSGGVMLLLGLVLLLRPEWIDPIAHRIG